MMKNTNFLYKINIQHNAPWQVDVLVLSTFLYNIHNVCITSLVCPTFDLFTRPIYNFHRHHPTHMFYFPGFPVTILHTFNISSLLTMKGKWEKLTFLLFYCYVYTNFKYCTFRNKVRRKESDFLKYFLIIGGGQSAFFTLPYKF